MDFGDELTVTITAKPLWNDTGISLQAGGLYRLQATGQWSDASIICGPAGYASPNWWMGVLERFRRSPYDPWFALIGAVDHDPGTQFLIGTDCLMTASRSGQLTCFANDVAIAYWNNTGVVELTVTRLGPPSTAPKGLSEIANTEGQTTFRVDGKGTPP